MKDKEPLDRMIQIGLRQSERKLEGRCEDCGNFVDGKDVYGYQETGPGVLDVVSEYWRCHPCQALRDDHQAA